MVHLDHVVDREAVRRAAIVAPLRTPVGRFLGMLAPLPAERLAQHIIEAVVARSTGGRILATMLHELARRGGKRTLETMCIGGCQGIAAVFEAA